MFSFTFYHENVSLIIQFRITKFMQGSSTALIYFQYIMKDMTRPQINTIIIIHKIIETRYVGFTKWQPRLIDMAMGKNG